MLSKNPSAPNGTGHSLNGKMLPHPAVSEAPPTGFTAWPGYSHILVPTALVPQDRAALLLGLQMAAAYRAQVTLLHVVPAEEPANSVHWLDAIDNLHRKITRPGEEFGRGNAIEAAGGRISTFLERTVPANLRAAVKVNAISRQGEVAREIARFADQAAVDLVILSSSQSAWKLPLWPGISQRVLQQTARKVILLRPDANDPSAPTASPAVQVVHP